MNIPSSKFLRDILGYISSFFLLIVVFNSCSNSAKDENHKVYFFDSESYFKQIEKEMSSSDLKIRKLIENQEGIEEEHDFFAKDINWKKELAPFYECNINKASLKDSYVTDSTLKDSVKLIYFNAIDSSSVIRKMTLLYRKGNSLPAFSAMKINNNILYESSSELFFDPGNRYAIIMKQKIKYSGPEKSFVIRADIY